MAYRFNIFTGTLDLINTSTVAPSVNKMTVTVDFGSAFGYENDTTSTAVSAPWVTANTVLLVTLGSQTLDHDLEDSVIENIIVSIGNIVPGVGFDVMAHSENYTWGQYQVNIVGA